MLELIIFTGAGLLLAGVAYYLIRRNRKKKEDAKRNVWLIPFKLFMSILLEVEQEMVLDGYGRASYIENVFDCSDIAPIWCRKLRKKLAPHVPKGLKLFIYPFSFEREDKPARHQVSAARTDKGEFYVDTYRLDNGNLLRTLSDNEKLNGHYIYK